MKARLSGIATSIPALRVLPALVALALVAAACGASSPPARQTALLSIIPPAMTTTVHADTIDGEHVVFTPVDLNADAARREAGRALSQGSRHAALGGRVPLRQWPAVLRQH